MCGATTEFDENTALIKNGEKRKDLCPECEPKVEAFIDEKKQAFGPAEGKEPKWDVDSAVNLLMGAGYKVLPPTPGKRKK